MKKLRRFGCGDSSIEWGYDLPLLVSHLESLMDTERESVTTLRGGPRAQRVIIVEDALEKLYEALEWEPEG